MPFLSLPPEILSLIFSHLPPTLFHDFPSLLTISKHWYPHAHFHHLTHLHLTLLSLPRFPPPPPISDFIQDHTSSLTLTFSGSVDYQTPLKARLEDLATNIERLRTLKAFSFYACYCKMPWEMEPDPEIPEEERRPLDYLWTESIYDLLLSLPSTLTSLTLDTVGSELLTPRRGPRTNIRPQRARHICMMFRELASLRALRVRMDEVCGEVWHGKQIKDVIISLRTKDQEGKRLGRKFVECGSWGWRMEDEEEWVKRLWVSGGEAMRDGVGRRCVVLGEAKKWLWHVECGTGAVSEYEDEGVKAWEMVE